MGFLSSAQSNYLSDCYPLMLITLPAMLPYHTQVPARCHTGTSPSLLGFGRLGDFLPHSEDQVSFCSGTCFCFPSIKIISSLWLSSSYEWLATFADTLLESEQPCGFSGNDTTRLPRLGPNRQTLPPSSLETWFLEQPVLGGSPRARRRLTGRAWCLAPPLASSCQCQHL